MEVAKLVGMKKLYKGFLKVLLPYLLVDCLRSISLLAHTERRLTNPGNGWMVQKWNIFRVFRIPPAMQAIYVTELFGEAGLLPLLNITVHLVAANIFVNFLVRNCTVRLAKEQEKFWINCFNWDWDPSFWRISYKESVVVSCEVGEGINFTKEMFLI